MAIGAAALGGGALALGVGTIVGTLVRDAFRAERATDDGPDDLLSDPSWETERQTVRTGDGTRLNVELYGSPDLEGDIVVAVHGWTCRTAFWFPQVNALAGEHRVVTYDQRGHGLSERGRARPTIAMLGQDLDAVLEAVVPKGRRVVLIGHSMGGMSIMSWAAQYPEKVADLVSEVVLTSTAAKAVIQNSQLIPLNLPRYTRPFEPLIAKAFTSAPMPIPKSSAGSWMSHYMALGPKARRAHVDFIEEMIQTCPPRTRAGWGSAMGKLDVVAGLEALTVPTTVVVGSSDRLTPPSHAEQIADVLRRNGVLRDVVVYDGVGHMAPIEAAEKYNALLARILDPAPSGS